MQAANFASERAVLNTIIIVTKIWKDYFSEEGLPTDLAPSGIGALYVGSAGSPKQVTIFQNPPVAAHQSINDIVGNNINSLAIKLSIQNYGGINFKEEFEASPVDVTKNKVSDFINALFVSKETSPEVRLIELPVPVNEYLFLKLLKSIANNSSNTSRMYYLQLQYAKLSQ